MLSLIRFGTLRQMNRRGVDVTQDPAGATHVAEWSLDGASTLVWERSSFGRTLVWERSSFGRTLVWDATEGAWINRESHYQARRQLA